MLRKVKVSAPGKIILSGEHAVVYGYPAILSAIDKRLTVEIEKGDKELEVIPKEGKLWVEKALELIRERLGTDKVKNLTIGIDSQIPIGCGLGSSAAFAVAVTAAIFEFLRLPRSRRKTNEIAYEVEKKQHGTPSGGDNTVSTYGGFLLYRKETEAFKVFSSLKTKIFPQIFLINSGKPEESTGEMIKQVKDFISKSPLRAEKIFREIEKITRDFLRFLSGEGQNFGNLIRTNESYLEELGVVSDKTKTLIRKIESLGGSAKISGAGGFKGNSGIIITYHADQEKLISFAKKENLNIIQAKLGEQGVRVEQN